MKRLFIALWPDKENRRLLRQLNRKLLVPGSKPMNPANFHVTLVFIGSVTEQKAHDITYRLVGVSANPLQLIFDELSYWRKPRILCLTSSAQVPAAMMDLVNQLSERIEALGVVIDKRPYRPHITLARKAQRALTAKFDPIIWRADAFSLVESVTENSGLYYKVLQTWQF